MKLTPEQVKKVAKLANLPLTEEEEEKYSEQLSKILDYVEQLNSVDTSGVEPTFNVTGNNNILAEDEPRVSFPQEDVLSNALQTKEGVFVTKGVFED